MDSLGVVVASSSAPNGATGLHLRTSLHTASTKGNLGRSSYVGSRSRPVMASSSACALICRSGRSRIARKAVNIADTICKWKAQNGFVCFRVFIFQRTVSAAATENDFSYILALWALRALLTCIQRGQCLLDRFLHIYSFRPT